MNSEFKIGYTYYCKDGTKVELLAIAQEGLGAGKYVVSQIIEFDTYEGTETARGDVFFAEELFRSAPRELKDKELEKLREEEKRLQDHLSDLRRDILNAEKDNRARIDKLKSYKGLERLEEFIDGRITHLVVEEYGYEWSIKPISFIDYIDGDTGYGRKPRTDGVKLVTLFGNSKGDLTWSVNRYKDGSGHEMKIIPCASEEEAIAKRKDIISQDLSFIDSKTQDHWLLRRVQAALKYGVDVPEPLMERYRKAAASERVARLADLQKNVREAQEKLSKFESEEAA